MKKFISKVKIMFFILLCMGLIWSCESSQTQAPGEERTKGESTEAAKEEKEESKACEEETEKETERAAENREETENVEEKNAELFYQKAEDQGVDRESAEAYFKILLADDIFQNGMMMLTGLVIDDMDGNGQKDMLVMVLDAEERPFYGSGCLWFYMNDDVPYCFDNEDCSYCGWFYAFWADVDNDENVEIIFSAQGSGVGAAGDSYKAVFKYKDHGIERMELPSDFEEDYDCGFKVTVRQEPQENSYSAYCSYLDETIPFQAVNVDIEGWEPPDTIREVGGNVRGFFDLQCVEYEGKNALQVSEYLCGEGGIVHGVATAHFLIVWEDGKADVVKWWVESDEDVFYVQ